MYTTDNNILKLPTGAVDWLAAYNAFVDTVERGRSISALAGEAITQYQAVYIKAADSKAYKAKNLDNYAGIAIASYGAGSTGYYQTDGTITNAGWAFTVGSYVYVDSVTPGLVTATMPVSNALPVGYALTATKILLLPTRGLPSGRLTSSTTSTGTDAATTEKTLATYTVQANLLSLDGRALKITAFGITAANGNTKTIRLKYGGTTIGTAVTSTSGDSWRIDATVIRTGATTQVASCNYVIGSVTSSTYTTPAETLSGAVNILVTGQNETSSANDIEFKGLTVEYLR